MLVAKLTTGELAIGDLWFGGRTRNPWRPERGSSESSAGPASATAAGLVGFAVGSETGGSIMSPASTCGAAGLRPTYGRSSRSGVMTLRWTLDKVGPLCRSVEDCALVLNAIYGPDGRDLTVADMPFAWDGGGSIKGLRIGVLEAEFEAPAAPSDSASVTLTNLTGHPAVTMNAGFADGLPVGLMAAKSRPRGCSMGGSKTHRPVTHPRPRRRSLRRTRSTAGGPARR